MLAFALWDRTERSLTLARDRVGKKPLYYYTSGNTLIFASELKALKRHPAFNAAIDREALSLFIRFGWVPAPYSIFKDARKLSAGSLLIWRGSGRTVSRHCYWSVRDIAERGEREPFSGSYEDETEALEALLRDATRKRMIADVKLGALLSSGIDSSTIVSIMQSLGGDPVKTFTIGFSEAKYDEAPDAKAIASHLGTEHKTLYVSPEDGLSLIPQLPSLYDEPFADPSAIPTAIVSRLARGDVTVALSGDGGDELFAGYGRYFRSVERWRRSRHWPLALRQAAGGATGALSRRAWLMLGAGSPAAASLTRPLRFLGKLEKRAAGMGASSALDLFVRSRSRIAHPHALVIGAMPVPDLHDELTAGVRLSDPLQTMMLVDFAGYLADNNLVKVDRASMGVSLEIPCPLLDHRVVEFAWSLPLAMRVGPAGGKRILRDVLARYLPQELFERPKRGFGVPIATWLRGPLRDWAESLLDERRLLNQGILEPAAVRGIWRRHQTGWCDCPELVWNLLMFQAWLDSPGAVSQIAH